MSNVIPLRAHMADTLRPHKLISQRLLNGLLNFGSYHRVNLDHVLKMHREDPNALERAFLRTPNAGRKTYDELTEFLDSLPDDGDLTGRVITVNASEAELARNAIDQVCHHVASTSELYRYLRNAQTWLTAAEIRIVS